MAYEVYKILRTEEEYFKTWKKEDYDSTPLDERKIAYNKYVLRCLTFQRDNFTCLNENCRYCGNVKEPPKLERHHIKWRKNNGQDKLKNSATLCHSAHKNFHRGKDVLVIAGKEYKDNKLARKEKGEIVTPKEFKVNSKKIRKREKEHHGFIVTLEMVKLLLKWLNIPYWEIEKDDYEDVCDD